jgi:hypothetical protein
MKATAAEYPLLNLPLEACVCVCDTQTEGSVDYYALPLLSRK